MPKYNRIPLAFTRNVPDSRRSDREVVGRDGGTPSYGPVDYNFIITDFDMSSQANASIYVIGDDYRVASYGNKYAIKKINGVIPNPTENFLDAIEFYKVIGICNNFGTAVSIDYKNYHGAGQIVGMDITLAENDTGNISLTFLELWVDMGYDNPAAQDEEEEGGSHSEVEEYEHMLKTKRSFGEPWSAKKISQDPEQLGWYIRMYPDAKMANGVSDVTYDHRISNIHMSFTSRYTPIDSNRNVIYFGENPAQISMAVKVIDQDNMFRSGINKLMRGLQIREYDPYSIFSNNYNCTVSCLTSLHALEFSPTIVAIAGADVGMQVNYAIFNINAIASAKEILGIS